MKPRTILATVLGMALILLITACGTNTVSNILTVKGSGEVVNIGQDVHDFSSIQINMGADLALTQGSSEIINIEADDNLMQYIEAKVQNGRLIISKPDNINFEPSQPIRISATFIALTAVDILGSSNVTAANLDLDTLALSFFGSGSTELTGSVAEQTINIHGQAVIHNFGLTCKNVTADIAGNGTLEVNAVDTLKLTVAGMGIVRYTGNPKITQDVSGAADIQKRS